MLSLDRIISEWLEEKDKIYDREIKMGDLIEMIIGSN